MKDFTGIRVGKLIGIKPTEERRAKNIIWEMRCDCGNIVKRAAEDIQQAIKKKFDSCCNECSQKKDFTGNKYGYLTAVKPLRIEPGKGFIWEFKCDCGNITEKVGSAISRKEGALHCGCQKNRGSSANDLTDKLFGELYVLKRYGTSSRGRITWLCECSCGTKDYVVPGYCLSRGSQTHCGCKRQLGKNSSSFKGYGDIHKTYWTRIHHGAIIRNLNFDISIEDMWSLFQKQNGKCALSGVDITLGSPNKQTASIDRIDSNTGYCIDNVQWVHKKLNICKQSVPNDEFINWCKLIADYHR